MGAPYVEQRDDPRGDPNTSARGNMPVSNPYEADNDRETGPTEAAPVREYQHPRYPGDLNIETMIQLKSGTFVTNDINYRFTVEDLTPKKMMPEVQAAFDTATDNYKKKGMTNQEQRMSWQLAYELESQKFQAEILRSSKLAEALYEMARIFMYSCGRHNSLEYSAKNCARCELLRNAMQALKDTLYYEKLQFTMKSYSLKRCIVAKMEKQMKLIKKIPCTWCDKPATIQLTKYKGTKQGWYCGECYAKGLQEENDAIHGLGTRTLL